MGKAAEINKKQVVIVILGITAILLVSFTTIIIKKQQNPVISDKSVLNEIQNPVLGGQSNTLDLQSNVSSDSYINVSSGTLMVEIPEYESFGNNNDMFVNKADGVESSRETVKTIETLAANETGGIRGTITANEMNETTAVSAVTGTVVENRTPNSSIAALTNRAATAGWSAAIRGGTATANGTAEINGTTGWSAVVRGSGAAAVSGMSATGGTSVMSRPPASGITEASGTALSTNRMPSASNRTTETAGTTAPPTVKNSMGFINSIAYYMNIPDSEEERYINEAQRLVTMRPFNMGKYEVTQKEFREVMGINPSYFIGDDLPVENVSWYDAIEYCNALSRREGLPEAYKITGPRNNRVVKWDQNSFGYRLPTEAEWEYSCRAGLRAPFNTGDIINKNQANFFHNTTVSVGSFQPNNWGLYDMHGNVSEWCWDLYSESAEDVDNLSDEYRVLKGGSWLSSIIRLNTTFRDYYNPNFRSASIGFRVVRTIPNAVSSIIR